MSTPNRMMPSLLDRLTDPASMGTASAPGYGEREVLKSVLADLADLLNTRQTVTEVPAAYAEVWNSIVAYGLPDLVNFSANSPAQLAELAAIVADTIARFEPRLKKVRVHVHPAREAGSRHIRFDIEAALNVDPAPEVGFVTVLELSTGRATVKQDGDRG